MKQRFSDEKEDILKKISNLTKDYASLQQANERSASVCVFPIMFWP
jgi:hypothetical protein